MNTKIKNAVFSFLALVISFVAVTQLLAAQILFTPELELSEQYSDNIFLTHENEEDDFITTAGLDLTLQFLGRTSGLELNYNPSYNIFADHSDLDYWRHSGRLHLWSDLQRNSRLELTNDYLETEDPRDSSEDFSPEDPVAGPAIITDSRRRGRNRYRTNVTEGLLTHQFGARDSVYASLRYSMLEDIDTFENEPVDDYTNFEPSLGLSYWFAQRWGLELAARFSNRDYTDENDRREYTGQIRLLRAFGQTLSGFVEYRHSYLDYEEETDEDYRIYAPSVGIIYQFQKTANITIGASYYIQDFEKEDDNEGWFVHSEIFKRWAFRSSYIDLTGASGYRIDDRGVEDLGLNIYYAGRMEIGHNFSTRLAGSAYVDYRYDEYPNEEPSRTDHTIGAGTEIRYQTLSWMHISLAYDYSVITSDIETEEYAENSVILKVTMSPVTPIRLD